MLFIGHFSFDEIDADSQPKHGYFSSIVDAKSPDDAVAKFEAHIKQMKKNRQAVGQRGPCVYRGDFEDRQDPRNADYYPLQSSEGEFPASTSHSLPGVFGKEVEAFGFAPDVADHKMPNDGGFIEAKPFITFDY